MDNDKKDTTLKNFKDGSVVELSSAQRKIQTQNIKVPVEVNKDNE